MTEQTKAMTPVHSDALANYGPREAARELGERLRLTMPNAQSFTDKEALAVAQIALAHDLDPFIGEVWGLKSKEGKWYGVMVGIKGQRKSANRQAVRENTTYWFEYRKVMPSEYGQPNNAVVIEAYLRDTVRVQAWSKAVNSLTSVGVPYKEAMQMLGPAPFTLGVGVATPGEQSKMRIDARAKKRAEADALKQRFDVEFRGAQTEDFSVEEGDFTELPQETPIPHPASTVTESQLLAELGYAEPTPEAYTPPEDWDFEEPVSRETIPSDPNPYAMSIELAMNEVGSDGKRYGDCTDKELSGKLIGINKKLAMSDLPHAEREQYQFKRDAIATIKAFRESQPEAG